jgi:3'-5' exoribonuclease
MKKVTYVEKIRDEVRVEDSFMVIKKLYREAKNTIAYIGDKTGDIKSSILDEEDLLKVGDVIRVKGKKKLLFEVNEYKKLEKYDVNEYLPTINKPMEEIIREIDEISKGEFNSEETITLNNYFFENKAFTEKFVSGIGGLKQHHNYRGGLAEHTLNVMYLAKVLAYRYDCAHKDIAILAAKLHDIGKVEEYFVQGPFSVTLRGEMEGHIVIGITMLEEAFKVGGSIYSDDFKQRIKGCIVQHHGKVEYGSPKPPDTEEAFIVHYADYVDANFNKIGQIKDITKPGTWSEYDRRIGARLYI